MARDNAPKCVSYTSDNPNDFAVTSFVGDDRPGADERRL